LTLILKANKMNYIEIYEKMIPKMSISNLEDQKKRFENDIRHINKPHHVQTKIIEMLDEQIKKLKK
jgi:hypothetical protein